MASSEESPSLSESGSGSGFDSRSALEAARRKAPSAAKASGTVQPVATPATSLPPAKRARQGGDAGKGSGSPSALHVGEDTVGFEAAKGTVSGRGKKPLLYRVVRGRGGGGVPTSSPKKGGRAAAPSKLPEEESEERDFASVSSLLQLNGMGLDEEVLRVGIRMVDRSKVEEIEERLREFRMAELQMAADRAVLTNEVTKLFMDAYHVARKM